MDKGVFDPTSSKIEILVGPDRYEEPESEEELLDVDDIYAKDFDRVWREQELTCPGSLRSGRRPFRHRLSALKADRSSRSSWSPAARARRLSLRRLHRPCPRHRSRASGQGPRCRARPRIRHEERRPADLVARCRSLFRGREPAHRAPTPIIGQSKSRSSSQWPIRSPTLTRQAFRAMPQRCRDAAGRSDCQAFSYNGGILTGILVPSGFSTATGVSDDGNVLSGYFIDSNSLFKAIRWTKQMGSSR